MANQRGDKSAFENRLDQVLDVAIYCFFIISMLDTICLFLFTPVQPSPEARSHFGYLYRGNKLL